MDELRNIILNILRKKGISDRLCIDIANEIISAIKDADKNDNQDEAIAYIDGGSRGNPGEGASACIIYSNHKKIFEGGKFYKKITNNEAEYNALLLALSETLKLNIRRLTVYTDSELLARQINKIYSIKSPTLTQLYIQADQLIQNLDKFSIVNIPREQNRDADRLARLIMDQKRHLTLLNK